MSTSRALFALLSGLPLLVLQPLESCNSGDDDDDDTTPGTVEYHLDGDVRVTYDTYGIPHIFGKSLSDVAFGQGYAAARDRLWQMDYLRRQATGRLSEVLGEGYYSSDLFIRTAGIPRLAGQAVDRLRTEQPEVYAMLEAYSAGVNAYLEAAIEGRDGASLPSQIVALGYTPEPWRPTDSVAMDKALAYGSSSSITEELTIWLVGKLLGPEALADLLRPAPVDPGYIVPGFYDDKGTAMPVAAARKPSDWTPPSPEERRRLLSALEAVRALELPGFAGSNSWVISGEYTASGYPILANDTHEGVEHPATYHQVHLNTRDQGGTLDVVGFSFAGIPMVVFGHNRDAAIGLTLNMADVSDLYLETVVGDTVLFNGKAVPIESREETLCVRPAGGMPADCEERTVTVRNVPHHGPILPEETTGLPLDISMKWTGLEDSSLIPVLVKLGEVSSFADVEAALQGLVSGSVNVIYAGRNGDIGYTARADIPIRERLDPEHPPYMVMPGTGGYEWTGEILPDHLIPQAFNPASGYVVTANNDPAGLLHDNDPLNGPYLPEIDAPVYLSTIYDVGMRAYRIEQLIEAAKPARDITLDDVQAWQGDVSSRMAARLLPYLLDAAARRPDLLDTADLQRAMSALRSFQADEYRCRKESLGALLFHAWFPYAFRGMVGDETDPALFDSLDGTYTNMFSRPIVHFLDATKDLVDALDFQAAGGCRNDPQNPFCRVKFPSVSGTNYFDDQNTTDRIETRAEILIAALRSAVTELASRGPLEGQAWGDVHKITFHDPAGGYDPAATLGPYSIDGGIFTVDVADTQLMSGGEFVETMDAGTGPSQRTVYELDPAGIEVRDVLPGGQSERPGDAHFADQLELYLNNQTRALPFYPAQIEAATEATLTLPAGYPAQGAPGWD